MSDTVSGKIIVKASSPELRTEVLEIESR